MNLYIKITKVELNQYNKEFLDCITHNSKNSYIKNIIIYTNYKEYSCSINNVKLIYKEKLDDFFIISESKFTKGSIIYSNPFIKFGEDLFKISEHDLNNYIFVNKDYKIYLNDIKITKSQNEVKFLNKEEKSIRLSHISMGIIPFTNDSESIIKKPTVSTTPTKRSKKLDVIIVSVDYNDLLILTLQKNKRIFHNITVVTSKTDQKCKEICDKFGVSCIQTDIMYDNNSVFNKGKAINAGINSIENPDLILLLDADIIVENDINLHDLNDKYLYTSERIILPNYDSYIDYINNGVYNKLDRDQGLGFYQLFSINNNSINRNNPYPDNSSDASWSDLEFRNKFQFKKNIDRVIHLGDIAKNWKGRVTNKFIVDHEIDNNLSKINRIALCAIAKNENNYIKEWIEHYYNLGIDHVFLYDNNDIDGENFYDVIPEYINSGFVTIINVRGEVSKQTEAYTECYRNNYEKYNWIAYFDIDEFLELDIKYKNDVKKFLSESIFNFFNCIKVCWKQYDDNGLVKVENNNYSVNRFKTYRDVNENYVSNTTKSILRTVFDGGFIIDSPHGSWSNNIRCCNSIGEPVKNKMFLDKSIWDGALLKHYRFKTIEEYIINKINRGWPTLYGNSGVDKMNIDWFFDFNERTKEKEDYGKNILSLVKNNHLYINGWNTIKGEVGISKLNFGDDLNFLFIPKIIPYKIIPYRNKGVLIKPEYIDRDNYSFIGSVITSSYINSKTIIWGSGVKGDMVDISKMKSPQKICAVRGPLTRKKLLENGFECPEVYGDPALLLPLYYNPVIEKKYKVGIIKHWRTKNNLTNLLSEDVCLISFTDYERWTDVIDQILSCENIISESLHGLIISEAYNIPNLWIDIELEDLESSNFKFYDFFQSIGAHRESSFKITNNTSIEYLYNQLCNYKREFNIDLQKLIDSCPVKIILNKN
jgi:pyruvyltransferase